MSRHVWRLIYRSIGELNRRIPRVGRRCEYNDALIVAMYIWSVGHDRPMCWAADRSNYNSVFRPRRIPSRSQFCRRIKTVRCEALLRALQARWSGVDEVSEVFLMDGRPLVVGEYTQDRDARRGYVGKGFAKGYKLHALATEDGRIVSWRVTGLNVNEKAVAVELLDEAKPHGIVLADGGYDSGKLYDHALSCGSLLFTPLPRNAGGGHRPQSKARLFAAWLWANGGAALYKERMGIERYFSQQSTFGGGLAPLPSWVRTLPRVERWVGTKLLFYHVRLTLRRIAA